MFLLEEIKNIRAGVRNTKIHDMNSVKSKSGNFKFTLLHIITLFCIRFLEGRLHAIIGLSRN